jgi:Peptidase family M28
MDDELSPGLKAYEHVRVLVEDIGPRPAGSKKEEHAFNYIALQLIRLGYQPEKIPIDFAGPSKLYPFNILGGILLALAGLFAQTNPLLTLWIPLVFALLPDIARWEIRLRPRTQKSANLVAYSETDSGKPLLILCAHVDSALALPAWGKIFRYFYVHSFDIVQRVAYLVATASIISLLGFDFPIAFWRAITFLAFLVGGFFAATDIWKQFGNQTVYSPGAVDNASGVGVLLALAEHYSTLPPKRVRLGFLFTSAEETGLHGAQAFAKELRKQGGKTAVINFDMVGAGDVLNYVSKDGVLNQLSTDSELNEVLKKADPNVCPVWYSIRSADFAAFLRNKVPAISLETSGSAQAKQAYHSAEDQLELVEPGTLDRVIRTAIKFIELLPYSPWNLSK